MSSDLVRRVSSPRRRRGERAESAGAYDDSQRRLHSPPARDPPAPGPPRDCGTAANRPPDPSDEHGASEHRSPCYDRAMGAPRCPRHHPAKRRGGHGRWGARHRPASRLTPAVVRRAPAHDERPPRAEAQTRAAAWAAADGLCVPRARHARRAGRARGAWAGAGLAQRLRLGRAAMRRRAQCPQWRTRVLGVRRGGGGGGGGGGGRRCWSHRPRQRAADAVALWQLLCGSAPPRRGRGGSLPAAAARARRRDAARRRRRMGRRGRA